MLYAAWSFLKWNRPPVLYEGDTDNRVRMRCGIINRELKKYRAWFQPDVTNRAEFQPNNVTMILL
jgi:hypothetical protein